MKNLYILKTFALFVCTFWLATFGVQAANGTFGGGNGTAETPYIIEDAADLDAVRSNLSAHYKLGNDVDHHTITVLFKSILSACPDQIYDVANGITYNIVELAGLCWIKENLRSTKYADGSDIPFAQPYYQVLYPDVAQNETDFGLLYDWYSAAKVTRSVQGICPNGWRLPIS